MELYQSWGGIVFIMYFLLRVYLVSSTKSGTCNRMAEYFSEVIS